jgi:hypothetical protein
MKDTLAPVALFVYNRPEHTGRTLAALRQNRLASETDLVIYSDAPKNKSHAEAVKEVRRLIGRIDGFKSALVIERQSNWGLARSIIGGVSELIEQRGKVIVLEDDLITSPYFLTFMNEALERYENKKSVMQISGHMFPVNVDSIDDAFFLPFVTSWGWATWKRAWECFDAEANDFGALRKNTEARRRFDLNGAYPYFSMLEMQMKGRIDSWAIRWYLSVFMQEGLVLYPRVSLIQNEGFDGSGTHCTVSDCEKIYLADEFDVRNYPISLTVKPECERKIHMYLRAQQDFNLKRAKSRLRFWLAKLKSKMR